MTIFKKVLKYLEKENLKYRLSEKDKHIAVLGIATNNAKFHCLIKTEETDSALVFLSIFPINTPEKMRFNMAELLLRLNYTLFLGCFEMDFEDGEIRFKTSIICESAGLTDSILDPIVSANIDAMDKHFDLLNTFINQKITMQEAIARISSQS
jgi:hypothetical protein